MLDRNPLDNYGNTTTTQVNYDNFTGEIFGERLTRVLNTLWMASIAPEYLAGDMSLFSVHSYPLHPGNVTDAQVVVLESVFVCSIGWLLALLGSSIALFLLGVWAFILKHQIPLATRFSCVSSLDENRHLFETSRATQSLLDHGRRTA